MATERANQITNEDEQTTLKVEFATDLLIVTFLTDSRFSGRRLAIKGEALSWGFDAYPSTMRWGKPHENETIDDATKTQIAAKILEENSKNGNGFEIIMNIISHGDGSVVLENQK